MNTPTQSLLSADEAQILLDSLLDIATHPSLAYKDRFPRLRQLYEAMLKSLTKEGRRHFASLYGRSLFVFDKYRVPDALVEQAHFLRKKANKAIHELDFEPSETDYTASVKALCELFSFFSGVELPEALTRLYQNVSQQDFLYRPPTSGHHPVISLLRGVVLAVGEVRETKRADDSVFRWRSIQCAVETPEDLERITIILKEDFLEFGEQVWRYTTFHATNLRQVPDRAGLYYSTDETIFVLEPDVVISATDIADGFSTSKASNPGVFLLKKFSSGGVSASLVIGNIVNSLFDDLIANPETDFDTSFQRAARQNTLSMALLGERANLREIHDQAKRQFAVLREVAAEFRAPVKRLEPSFISEVYGIQGRMDAMFVSEGGKQREIVELKSGQAPNDSVPVYLGQDRVKTLAWPSHYVQTVCYDLLLRSTFGEWNGTPVLLYSRDSESPLRSIEVTLRARRETLKQRNRLVSIEFQLARGELSLQQGLTASDIGEVPSFLQQVLSEFAATVNALSPLERAYFDACIRFIAREHLIARIGGWRSQEQHEDDAGFAGLWLKSVAEKKQAYRILANLIVEEFDDRKDIVYLRRPANDQVTSLREGDIVVLYPLTTAESPLRSQIIKGTIVHLDGQQVHIAFRGTRLINDYLRQHTEWAVEPDLMDSGFNHQYMSLYEFLKAPAEKRSLLLGRTRSRFRDPDFTLMASDLNANQTALLRKALAAQDYFLLQGPPGTGKTSRMVRELVRHLAAQPDETIVLLAFTNKAVEEMCRAIGMVVDDYLVLGERARTFALEHSLAEYAENHKVWETISKIRDTRIFVSTVASFLGNQDLQEIKRFTTALVDEASQLLDVHLVGILSKVQRFILIGDEKQLPPVVTQEATALSEDSILAREANIKDLSASLFDRLIRTCQENGWDDAYGMLEYQSRMHKDIQAFPSQEFYQGRLKPFGGWQLDDGDDGFAASPDPVLQILSSSRVFFIPSRRERRPKVHRQEAEWVVQIIKALEWHCGQLDKHYVGVIAPFRAQVAEISNLLPDYLRDLVTVDTVERFQGGEREIIIVSFAVSYPAQLPSIQSLTFDQGVDRKLNVAMTRARKRLILLGCPEVLAHSPDSHFARLLRYVRVMGGYARIAMH